MTTIPETLLSPEVQPQPAPQLPAVKKTFPKILRFRNIAMGAFFVLVAIAGLYFFANRQVSQIN